MKKTITLLFIILTSAVSQAQTVLYDQDFENFSQNTIFGWGAQFTGVVPWQTSRLYLIAPCMGGPAYNKVAAICDCGMIDYNNNNALTYTPEINFTNVEGGWLRFDSYFRKLAGNGKTERATIEISTDSGKNWTIVDDLPADTAKGYFQRHYINLSAYDHTTTINIGFRYSDNYDHKLGWAIDNVQVFIPSKNDLVLQQFTPEDSVFSYQMIGKGLVHRGRVFNAGLDTVYSYVVNYKQDGKTIMTDSITGVAIPRFGSSTFSHKIPDTVTAIDKANVTAWVELQGDTVHHNDTIKTSVRGAYFMPRKRLAIEEGTGTWNPWSPQGWVYMNQVANDDADPCLISVHDTDPMEVEYYADFMYNLRYNFVPYFSFDRRKTATADSFFVFYDRYKSAFGYADVSVHGNFSGNTLYLGAHVTPAIDMKGDFRLVVVITEDGVSGTTNDYSQKNIFANNVYGPMGGFENKANPVPANEMNYNFVARTASPAPEGLQSTIPDSLVHEVTYHYYFPIEADPKWNKEKLRAVVLFIRYDDSSILNSNKTMFYLDVNKLNTTNKTIIYPNPSDESSLLQYYADKVEKVKVYLTDISGRSLGILADKECKIGKNEIKIPTSGLPQGLYIVNIVSAANRNSIKLQVLH